MDIKNKKQVYPKTDFNHFNKIEVYHYKNKTDYELNKTGQVENIVDFFKDSTNYFKTDKILNNRVKYSHRLDFIQNKDTLTLMVYPTKQKGKIEIGFFEPKYNNGGKSSFRKFNRFYIKENLLNLIEGK